MTHGTDAVAELVAESELSYPLRVRRLLAEHALANIDLDERGNSLTLSELLGSTDLREFESEADLRSKVSPLVERHREARRSGPVARLLDRFR